MLCDGKELDPHTTVKSEDLSGVKTDRFQDAMRATIMHTIDDNNGSRGFLTIPRQQRSLLDTTRLTRHVGIEMNFVDEAFALQDELPKQQVLLETVSKFEALASERIEQSEGRGPQTVWQVTAPRS